MEYTTKNLELEEPSRMQTEINSFTAGPDDIPSDGAMDSIVNAQLRLMRMLARLVVAGLRKIPN